MRIKQLIANSPEGDHSFQACYRMAIEALTGMAVDAATGERETGWEAGRVAWPYEAMLSAAKRGLHVKLIEAFPCKMLLEKPVLALKEFYKNTPKAIVAATNIPAEQKRIVKCWECRNISIIKTPATLKDIRRATQKGALAIPCVNGCLLNAQKGLQMHYVLVEDVTATSVVFHDPGQPAMASRAVERGFFPNIFETPTFKESSVLLISSQPL